MIIPHTPGPWRVSNTTYPEVLDIVTDDDSTLVVSDAHSGPDAYLIAAAPDLLEALVMLMHCGPNPRMGEWKRAIQNASAAIAKAEGRES